MIEMSRLFSTIVNERVTHYVHLVRVPSSCPSRLQARKEQFNATSIQASRLIPSTYLMSDDLCHIRLVSLKISSPTGRVIRASPSSSLTTEQLGLPSIGTRRVWLEVTEPLNSGFHPHALFQILFALCPSRIQIFCRGLNAQLLFLVLSHGSI